MKVENCCERCNSGDHTGHSSSLGGICVGCPCWMPATYVYVASSWRNPHQPEVVQALRDAQIEVYDFRNPPGGTGFAWSEIDPAWESWTAEEYVAALDHPRAREGFKSDMDALQRATHVVLVLPAGRSAHLELGWAAGAARSTVILTRDGEEPELMGRMADFITDKLSEVIDWITCVVRDEAAPR